MSDKAYDNTVLGEGGYSDAGEVDLSKVLTGEDTSSTLIDMMLGIAGPAGSLKGLTQLLKSKGGVEILKRLTPKTKDVKTFIEGMNKKSLENLKAMNKEIKRQGTKGYSTKVTDNLLPIVSKYTKGVPSVIPKSSPKQSSLNFDFDDIARGLTTFTSLLAAITASKANDAYGWTDKITSFFRPDPDMGTKEQHDEDMDMIIKTMSPEAKLKYLKQTGQGYPADEEMFLRAEPENTNEILLELLNQQISPNEKDEEISYPSKYTNLYK